MKEFIKSESSTNPYLSRGLNLMRRGSPDPEPPAPIIYLPEAQAIFDQMVVLGDPASVELKAILNTFVGRIVDRNWWNKVDVIWMFVMHGESVSLFDLRNPTTRFFTITNNYAGSFVPFKHFIGKPSSQFRINLNYNPGDGGIYNYKTGDASFGLYIDSSDTSNTGIDLSGGSASFAENQLILFGASGSARVNVNREQSSSESYNQMYGWYGGRLQAGQTHSDLYKNGAKKDENTPSGTGTVPYNNSWTLCCSHNDGAFSNWSPRKHKGGFAGSGEIDPGEMKNFFNEAFVALNSIPSKQILIIGNSFTATNTYVNRLFSYYSSANLVQDSVRGKAGYTIAQLIADFPTGGLATAIDPSCDKQVFIVQELLNSMLHYGSDQYATYADLVTLCNMIRAAGAKTILVITMLPSAGIIPSHRENPSDFLDPTTLNGMVRLNADGAWDDYIDAAADPILGPDSMGVPGVGERNTEFYAVDQRHLITPGYQRYTDVSIYPKVDSYLN